MMDKKSRDKNLIDGTSAQDVQLTSAQDVQLTSAQDVQLTSEERRQALVAIAKFAKYTGPGIALLLASEQAVASGGDDGGDDCPFCH